MLDTRSWSSAVFRQGYALSALHRIETKLAAVLDAFPELGIAGFADTAPTKHEVEHWGRREHPEENSYTPNGAMVAALLLVGTPVERRGINAVVVRGWTEAARRYALPGKTPSRCLRASNRETVVRKSENPDACRC